MTDDRATEPILAQAELAIRQWRTAHPTATFAQIEAELDRELRVARARLLAAVVPDVPAGRAPTCPDCGSAMVWRGAHERTLQTDGDQTVPLRRAYAHCPRCGSGLFPPGPDA